MPNGRSIVLERQQSAHAGGYSGLEDEVDNHWTELFKAALLSTILGVGVELGSAADTGNNTDVIQALRLSAAKVIESDWTAVGTTQPEYSAHVGNQAGLPGEGDCQSRSHS